MNDNQEKNFIVIPGLEGNDPASLTPLQQAIQPYALGFEAFYWALWGVTLLYVAGRYVVIPFFKQITQK